MDVWRERKAPCHALGGQGRASVSLQVIGAENHNMLVYKELQK